MDGPDLMPLGEVLTVAASVVADAFAGVTVFRAGGRAGARAEPLPGMHAHELLAERSELLDTVRSRLLDDEVHMTFVWPDRRPHTSCTPSESHVRVTYLAITGTPVPGLLGIVVLSPAGPLHGLTARELDVLGMMVEGCSNQQIADELVVTPRTVATHVEHILAKLASPSRTHAAVHAQREGLFVPAPTGRAVAR